MMSHKLHLCSNLRTAKKVLARDWSGELISLHLNIKGSEQSKKGVPKMAYISLKCSSVFLTH